MKHTGIQFLIAFGLLVRVPLAAAVPPQTVTPSTDFGVSGSPGGPFSPLSTVYTLSNGGVTPISWTVSNTTSWLVLSATNGTLAGNAGTNITISINTNNANAFPAGAFSDTVSFSNATAGILIDTRNVTLSIGGIFFSDDFSTYGQNTTLVPQQRWTASPSGAPIEPFVTNNAVYVASTTGPATADEPYKNLPVTSNGSVFVGMAMTVTAAAPVSTASPSFIATEWTSQNVSGFRVNLFTVRDTGTGTYVVAARNNGIVLNAYVFGTTPLNYGTAYRVILQGEAGNSNTFVYVNPGSATLATNTADVAMHTVSAVDASIGSFQIGNTFPAAGASSVQAGVAFSKICISTNYADVYNFLVASGSGCWGTNVISAISTNVGGPYYVGDTCSNNYLEINSGGLLIDTDGYIGHASSANNNAALVSGNGSVWSNQSNFFVGNSSSGNALFINTGGAVSASGHSIIGNSGNNNNVVVSGGGSVWSSQSFFSQGGNYSLVVGMSGNGNSLIVSNGATVINYAVIGDAAIGSGGNSNSVLVAGSGSVWTNRDGLLIGWNGGNGNSLVISNGGVVCGGGFLGEIEIGGGGNDNRLVVTGPGSVLRSDGQLSLAVNNGYSGNTLIISNGGVLVSSFANGSQNAWIGSGGSSSTNNRVQVSGSGSVWSNRTPITIGSAGSSGNSMVISSGGTVISGLDGNLSTVGNGGNNNSVLVSGNGSMWNNQSGLEIGRNGGSGNSLVISNGGELATDSLVLTNVNGSLVLNGGLLFCQSSIVSNGQRFVVGSHSTFQAGGGIQSFADGLLIQTNSAGSGRLSGSGTITGNVVNQGDMQATGGTTLNFTGAVTNNTTITATGGTVLKFYGPVVNTGLIDATGGNVQFLSTVNDGGTILTPANSWTDGTGKWETSGNWSAGVAPTNTQAANLITNAASKIVTIDATTSGSFPDTMTIRNLNMAGAGSSTNTLSLNNAGLGTPLHVRDQLSLGINSVVVVNNSALQVDGMLSVGLTLGGGNQLTVTNGGQLVSALAIVGGVPSSSNSVVITGSGSTWVNTNDTLAVRNNTPGTAITIANGASMKAGGVFIGDLPNCNSNVVLVTDPGSSWSNMFTLTVGGPNHDAQFVISNGASVYTWNAIIGYPVGHNHSALITGSNSLWKTDGPIAVGIGGTGDSLTIAAGGALIASNASHSAEVVVDAATVFIGDGTFQVDNLVLTNGGAIQYTQTYHVENASVTVASGSDVQAASNFVVAASATSTSSVSVATGGSLTATNGVVSIGNDGTVTSGGGVATMTVDGSLTTSGVLLGSSTGGQGEMILRAGGQIKGVGTNCVWICNDFTQIGGDLGWTNIGSIFYCGYAHPGAYALSNGTSSCQDVYVGYDNTGSMTIAGGSMSVLSRLIVGHLSSPLSTGVVWITGGQLTAVNSYSIIGNSGVGRMTISNGVVMVADVIVGNGSNPGTLTLAGGTLTLNNLVLPNPGSRFIFSGGWLNAQAVSNANGQIVTVGNSAAQSTLKLLGSISIFDKGLTISANATLTGSGTISGSVANFGLIMPGDSILSFTGIVTNNGLIVTNSAVQFLGGLVNNGTILDAAGDADGDGMNNLSEVLAGTNPTNSASVFRVTAATIVGNDVQVSWSTVGGKRYVVQAGTASGGYTNNFNDLSSVISVPGTGESITSYVDSGAAASNPTRYYRVRLAP